MDKLEQIFERQAAFQRDLLARRHLEGVTQQEWIQKQTLAVVAELAEVLDEVNYRWWKDEKPVDGERLKEELVDVLHFFVSMCLTAGMDADELFARYVAKNQVNFDRQNGKTDREGYKSEATEGTR